MTTAFHKNIDRFTKYPSEAGSDGTSFALSGGYIADSSGLTLYKLQTARGVRITFGAQSSAGDNDTFNYRIWGVGASHGPKGNNTGGQLSFLGSGVATLGAGTFLGGVAASATGRMADTLTWIPSSTATSPKGPMTDLEASMASGGSRAYSPANDTEPAELIIPDCWYPSIHIEFDSDVGAPLGMFALIERF